MNEITSTESHALYVSRLRRKMDHDVRSILNVVLGYCSYLMEEAEEGPLVEATSDLLSIQGSSEELLSLNERVSDLFRISSGQWDAEQASLDLADLLGHAVSRMQSVRPGSECRVEGTAIATIKDVRALRSIVAILLEKLSATVPGNARFVMTVADSALIRIAPDTELDASEARRFLTTLQSLTTDQAALNETREFDAHYITVMRRMMDVTVTPDFDALACEIHLPG